MGQWEGEIESGQWDNGKKRLGNGQWNDERER